MAGAEGFEPPKAVLETAGLPLAYAPRTSPGTSILLDFLVRMMFAAIWTKFLKLETVRCRLFVLHVAVVPVLALSALERDNFASHLLLLTASKSNLRNNLRHGTSAHRT